MYTLPYAVTHNNIHLDFSTHLRQTGHDKTVVYTIEIVVSIIVKLLITKLLKHEVSGTQQ